MNSNVGLNIGDKRLYTEVKSLLDSISLPWVNVENGDSSVDLIISDQLLPASTPLVLIQPQPILAQLSEAINSGRDIVWFSALPEAETLTDIIRNALENSVWSKQSILLSKEINIKNRQLEQMNEDMESIVENRTSTVAEEKKLAEAKLKKIRNLVEFVKLLSESETLSDYIECVRKEFRHFFAVTDVFLTSEEKSANLQAIRKDLANHLGRPVGPIFVLRLHTKSIRRDKGAVFLIEHGMEDEALRNFIDFTSERLQIMSLALERIFLFDDLTKSSLEWESTFDTLKDPVGIVDVDYKLLRANSSFGASSYKSNCHKVFAISQEVCEGCPVKDAALTGSPQIGQVRRGNRVFRVHSYPIKMSQDTQVTTVVNHYVDITVDRLLYSRVIQHEKMTALGIMAGHIAHELNNPLTGIRSLCQVLKIDTSVAEALKKDLLEIENASERCQVIIRNLLDFTLQRDEEGVQETSLNNVIKKTLPMLKTAMRFHNSEINLTENEDYISANPHLLQQVVFNLVNNSCQAMQTPGQVKIVTENLTEHMVLRISDTGQGIPQADIPRLFEPFFTTKPLGEGTGLGLSISRAIVEKFGGKIVLLSTGSDGTTFEISFPKVTK